METLGDLPIKNDNELIRLVIPLNVRHEKNQPCYFFKKIGEQWVLADLPKDTLFYLTENKDEEYELEGMKFLVKILLRVAEPDFSSAITLPEILGTKNKKTNSLNS